MRALTKIVFVTYLSIMVLPIPEAFGQAATDVPATNGNQSNTYDSRIPPAGTYIIKQADGSTDTLYTTGEKKPYIVDNNSNAPIQPIIQPYVTIQPPTTK
jgi:hypothetical protein